MPEIVTVMCQISTVEPRFTGPLGPGKGFRPGISGGPVNRIVKYTNLHINRAFGEGERSR